VKPPKPILYATIGGDEPELSLEPPARPLTEVDWDADVGLADTLQSVELMMVRIEEPPTRRFRRRRGHDSPLPRGLLIDAMTAEQRSELRRLRWELKAYSYLSALSRRELRDRQNDRFERVCRKRAKRAARAAHRSYHVFLRAYVESKGGTWA
jgi:hypothetical protein